MKFFSVALGLIMLGISSVALFSVMGMVDVSPETTAIAAIVCVFSTLVSSLERILKSVFSD